MPDIPKTPTPITRPPLIPEECPHCGKTNCLTLKVIISGYTCPQCGKWVDGHSKSDAKIEISELQ